MTVNKYMQALTSAALGVAMLTANAIVAPSIASAAEEALYNLDTGDKLRVKVHEWPDLTGEYRITPDGSLPLPVIGDLKVRGLTPSKIAESIAQRLKDRLKLGELPTATVEIVQSRPYFILGHIMKPGEYEFRPKTTVLQAVSVAGGLFRFNDPGLQRLDRDSITSRGELHSLARRLDQLRAQEARIKTEQQGLDEIPLPPELAGRQDDATVKRVLDEQRAILQSNRQALAQEVESAAKIRDLLQKEVASLSAQAEAEERQLKTVNLEMEGVKTLAERGLTTNPRTYLLERTKAQIVGQKQAIETNIIRARQSIETADQRLNQYRNQMIDKLHQEMVKNQADASDVEERTKVAQKLVLEAEVTAPTQIAERYSDDKVRYMIIRAGSKAIPADESTMLQPNDVLKVERLDPSTVTQQGASSGNIASP